MYFFNTMTNVSASDIVLKWLKIILDFEIVSFFTNKNVLSFSK